MSMHDTMVETSRRVIDAFDAKGIPLTDGVIKEARELNFSPEQTEKLLQFVNVGAHLRKFSAATGPDRVVEFDVAQPSEVMAALFPARLAVKAAAAPLTSVDNFDASYDYWGPAPKARRRSKVAGDGGMDDDDDCEDDCEVDYGGSDDDDDDDEGEEEGAEESTAADYAPVDEAAFRRLLDSASKTAADLKNAAHIASFRYEDAVGVLVTAVSRGAISSEKMAQDLHALHGRAGVEVAGAVFKRLRQEHLPSKTASLAPSAGVVLSHPTHGLLHEAVAAADDLHVKVPAWQYHHGQVRQLAVKLGYR